MGRYTVIPKNAFDALQMDAGVLLFDFDVVGASASKDTPGFQDKDIICATTGGINAVCQPTYSDFAEDVDNAPNNLMEFKHLDGWNCSLSTTAIGTSAAMIQLSLGAADVESETGKITPRRDLKLTDFKSIWWVGDKANGGFVAINLKNALSTDGFSLQTGKNAKGQTTIGITGHVSLNKQEEVPMIFYSIDADDEPSGDSHSVTQTLEHVTSSFSDDSIEDGEALAATLTADEDYVISTVTVTMGEDDITSTAYDDSTHAVSIASVTADVVITATAVENV